MATGEKPHYRIIHKKEGDAKWTSIGAAWNRDDGESFSLAIELPDGSKMRCLMVINKPFKAAEQKSEPKQESLEDTTKGDEIPF